MSAHNDLRQKFKTLRFSHSEWSEIERLAGAISLATGKRPMTTEVIRRCLVLGMSALAQELGEGVLPGVSIATPITATKIADLATQAMRLGFSQLSSSSNPPTT